jgi:hypothetical protein
MTIILEVSSELGGKEPQKLRINFLTQSFNEITNLTLRLASCRKLPGNDIQQYDTVAFN